MGKKCQLRVDAWNVGQRIFAGADLEVDQRIANRDQLGFERARAIQ